MKPRHLTSGNPYHDKHALSKPLTIKPFQLKKGETKDKDNKEEFCHDADCPSND
jgi:hypothetical protein